MLIRTGVACSKIDADTLERAKGGDAEAYEEIFLVYRDRIFSGAYRLCNFDREAALDLTQDVFLKVWEKLPQFDNRSDLYTWIYRIMINLYLQERRRKWLHEKFLEMFGRSPDRTEQVEALQLSNLERQELKEALAKSMKKLSSKQEIVFKLRMLDGMSFAQIAEVTGMAEGTVKTHFFRALHTLRKELKEWVE
ncbi:MAG: RNA polymerase sigma factor [Thermodesulforhabdaceae bacterium]